LVVGCDKDEPETSPPAATATAKTNNGGDFLGCGKFCRQAGEYGDPGEEGKNPVELVDPKIALVDERMSVKVHCVISNPCRGSILILQTDAGSAELGRSDLEVDGNGSRIIAVDLSDEGRTAIGQSQQVDATVYLDLGADCPDVEQYFCVVEQDATVSAA
jgi:hypothetical protein